MKLPQKQFAFLSKKIKSFPQKTSDVFFFLKKQFFFDDPPAENNPTPWHLVLGPSQSGKTTLLSQADLNFIVSDDLTHPPTKETFSSISHKWWRASRGLFLDIPGHFLNDVADKRSAWADLLTLIKKQSRQQAITGVLFVINIYELAKGGLHPEALENFQKKLTAIHQKTHQNFPIYLVLTQCDRITGFNEFFSDLGPGERQQYWGLSLQEESHKTTLDRFNQAFDQLLRRLNQRLIWRLHHERNVDTKFLIRDFPAQLENLKSAIAPLVALLSDQAPALQACPLAGVYFCSGAQKGEQIDNLVKALAPTRTFENKSLLPTTAVSRAYFIQHLFDDIVLNPMPYHTTQTTTKTLPIGYFLTFIPPILASIFWIQNYQKQQAQLNLATQAYNHYQTVLKKEVLGPKQLLVTLNELQSALPYLEQFDPSLSMRSKVSLKESWEKTTYAAYQEVLITRLLPQVASILEQHLLSLTKAHPDQAYTLLKDYLMLTSPEHLDIRYLQQSLLEQHQTLFGLDHDEAEKYLAHLAQALTQTPHSVVIENTLAIQHARQLLDGTPYPLLAYALIKTPFTAQTLSFFDQKNTIDAFRFSEPKFSFSTLYTADKFFDIYNQLIPATSQAVSTGNWVLGKKTQAALSTEEITELTQDVREFYLSDYVDNWRKLLGAIELKGFANFTQSAQLLEALSGDNSALETLFQALLANTSISALSKKISDPVASKSFLASLSKEGFEPFNQIALNKHLLHTTSVILGQLYSDIHHINIEQNTQQAALKIAQGYMQNPENNPIALLLQASTAYPEPVKNWLESIAYGNWKLLLDASSQEINREWKAVLVPQYHRTLAQRYPLTRNTPNEAKVEDFKQFFSPQGQLANFFNNYLKPFIDTDKPRWKLLKIAGLSVALSDNAIEQFERASIISRMFFTEGTDQINIRFFLEPVAIMSNLKNITLRYNGKEIVDYPQQIKVSAWYWPSENTDSEVSVEFVNNEGPSALLSKKGEWAWFRLFDQSHLQPTQNPKRFELTFDLNGNAAKYALITSNAINPFIPDVIEQFHFPETLQ